jgi:predicted enzyme related to lactoylglutathione lyase
MDLNQVTIYTRDVPKMVQFYSLLGLKLIVDSSPRYVRFECPDGHSTLSLHTTESDSTGSSIVLYFECEGLDDEVERIESAGIRILSGPENKDWLWREAEITDPDGNKIFLFNAAENRKNPPWRLPQEN